MLNNLFLFIFYYFLILIAIYGYGLAFLNLNIKKYKLDNFGFIGLAGLFILLIYSYLSNFFYAHSILHNSILIIIGLVLFTLNVVNKYHKFRDKFLFSLLIFIILIISAFIFKNHDDFTYYHFPYTYYLTQNNSYLGVGQFNHGFRTPSSIFYLNSLFFLPSAKYYLFNFTQIYIMGFANIILLQRIYESFKNYKKSTNYLNYLILLSFIFINIFFYRISEHGTDRSAQILIFIFIILILEFTFLEKNYKSNLNYVYICLGLIVSLKAFYILYFILLIPVIYKIFKKTRKFFLTIKYFFNKFSIYLSLLIILVITSYFFNTGCIVYPLSFTCFENLGWALPVSEVNRMNDWYELWSKAGANPNYRVSNPEIYIQQFNWVGHWMKDYFFNKVSDLIFGIIFLVLIFSLFFIKPNLKIKKISVDKFVLAVYLFLFVLVFEWFYNHPALRYGGYCLFALIIFIPVSIFVERYKLNYKKYYFSVVILICLSTVIFLGRNLHRINKEINIYSYKPITKTFYKLEGKNFRIKKQMDELLLNFSNCEKLSLNCDLNKKQVVRRSGKIIFLTRK